MWTEAAISSTVTGCAKCVRMKDTASATRCTPDFGAPIWATRVPIGVRSKRIRISSTTSGPSRSASSARPIKSSRRVTASMMASVVRPTYSPRSSGGLGTPLGNTRAASSATRAGSRSS